MQTNHSRRVLIASLAGALAMPLAAAAQESNSETVHCYGVNKCKETGDCGGPGHSCANQNTCKRQGYIDIDKETCLRLDGGRLTLEAPAKDAAAKDEKKN